MMGNIPSTIFQDTFRAPVLVYSPTVLVNAFAVGAIDGSTEVTVGIGGSATVVTFTRNPALDITLNCATLDSAGRDRFLNLSATILGNWLNVSIAASALTSTTTIRGTYIAGIIASGLMTLTSSIRPNDTVIPFTTVPPYNFVKWSKVGYLDFTIGRDNVAGERPVDWSGWIYQIKKLADKVVVYGQNGVSFLIPRGSAFGLNTVYRIGLKGKHAVTGDDTKHFFIDNSGNLWKISDSLKKLDYSEYLTSLNSAVVMSYDSLNNLVYICDGQLGFILDASTESLGKCPANITGIGYKSGIQYVAASSTISTDAFEICTDVFDLGTRAGKTIFSIELGTDLTAGLYVSIDWRRDKSGSFTQTPWYSVSAQGRAFVIAYGREFRFRVKSASYEYFELDYIKVNGAADAY